jgi:hypothetical protein
MEPPKVHYCVLKSPLSVHVLKQINPADNLRTDFFKIYFNIIFHLHLALPKSVVYQLLLGPINELKSEGGY